VGGDEVKGSDDKGRRCEVFACLMWEPEVRVTRVARDRSKHARGRTIQVARRGATRHGCGDGQGRWGWGWEMEVSAPRNLARGALPCGWGEDEDVPGKRGGSGACAP
jgi:hypothetical protein